MESEEKILREGVRTIISQHSPVVRTDEVSRFQTSSHYKREILFVIKGTGSYMLNNSVFRSEPGMLFFIDRWVPHAFRYAAETGSQRHLWIHFEQDEFLIVFMNVENGRIVPLKKIIKIRKEYAEILKYRLEQYDSAEKKDGPLLDLCIRDAVNGILNEAAFLLFHQEQIPGKKNSIPSVIESVRTYIMLCSGKNCSYRELEQISGFSSSYLSHRFRECTGISVGECVDQARIDYTVTALKHGLKQKEIASELGFSSPANFWCWLRKHRDKIR